MLCPSSHRLPASRGGLITLLAAVLFGAVGEPPGREPAQAQVPDAHHAHRHG